MTVSFKTAAVSLLSLSMLGGVGAAYADPAHCPPGLAKKGWCGDKKDRHHDKHDKRDHYDDILDQREAYRDGYEEGRRDAIRYGDRSYTDYRVISDYSRYGLQAPPDGYYYAELNNETVLVAAATQIVTQLLSGN